MWMMCQNLSLSEIHGVKVGRCQPQEPQLWLLSVIVFLLWKTKTGCYSSPLVGQNERGNLCQMVYTLKTFYLIQNRLICLNNLIDIKLPFTFVSVFVSIIITTSLLYLMAKPEYVSSKETGVAKWKKWKMKKLKKLKKKKKKKLLR